MTLQQKRTTVQLFAFALFVFAPVLDLFRFDLIKNNFIFFGMDWTLGITPFLHGEISAQQATLNIFLFGFLPLLLVIVLVIGVSRYFGRLYCGWTCPHFFVVELINQLMVLASGKPSIWEKQPLPVVRADGSVIKPEQRYWILVWIAATGFAFLWAVSLLTYLLPPKEIYHNLFHGELTINQFRFITIATSVLLIEFMFARHLFCRFGCAVGLFQSLAWMANDRAMVVGFDKERSVLCNSCNSACENHCPMRLKPRQIKRRMFTCTECAQCITACSDIQNAQGSESLNSEDTKSVDTHDLKNNQRMVTPTPGLQKEQSNKSLLNWVSGDKAVKVAKGKR
jgi:polyferredoxin